MPQLIVRWGQGLVWGLPSIFMNCVQTLSMKSNSVCSRWVWQGRSVRFRLGGRILGRLRFFPKCPKEGKEKLKVRSHFRHLLFLNLSWDKGEGRVNFVHFKSLLPVGVVVALEGPNLKLIRYTFKILICFFYVISPEEKTQWGMRKT